MSQVMPSFWNSPYFVAEPDNWHLTEDAPDELKKEFEEYMKESIAKDEALELMKKLHPDRFMTMKGDLRKLDNDKSIKRELFDKLKEFCPDRDFVVGVGSNVSHDDDRQAIIDYISNGDDVTVENIILLSLHLDKDRKNNSLLERWFDL